jgi:transcriptional regulator with XRE-family HTH domain
MKRPREVADTSMFDQILNETPQADKNFIANSLNIAHQIISVMEQKGLRQKDLAAGLGKTEAEISRWLSGTHNFTIKTISKIQAILGEQIITTPKVVGESITDMFSTVLDQVFISSKDKKTRVAFSELDTKRYTYSIRVKVARAIPLPTNFEGLRLSSTDNRLTGTYS